MERRTTAGPDESTFDVIWLDQPEIKVGDEVAVTIDGFTQAYIVSRVNSDGNVTCKLKDQNNGT